ncbi:hypothetical protein BH09PLA1_BH09PLA1_13350 [soil metagenome]
MMRTQVLNRAIVCLLIAAMCTYPIASPAQEEPPPESPAGPQLPNSSRTPLLRKVESSINRGVKYLLARQNPDGSWGDTKAGTDFRVGETALVTLALLSCGESHQSKPLVASIKFLRTTRAVGLQNTYAIGLRACVWASLPEPIRGSNLKADLGWLLTTRIKDGANKGMYHYSGTGIGDFSNSQYGVLGVWYAAMSGLEVPTSYWKDVELAWHKNQYPDGGWPYMPKWGPSYASMTAAGAATLYITNDYLHADQARDLSVPIANKPLDNAIDWLGKHFAVDLNAGRDTELRDKNGGDDDDDAMFPGFRFRRRENGTFVHYMLFGYERVGEASGLTRFGKHRWFDEGAQHLIDTQSYDGSWTGSIGPICDTSYSLLFLSRGRSPVAIQKLQFQNRWNNRPRDAANFIRFMRHATERHMNWQIVSADAPIDDLREAPILYLASDRPLELSEPQRKNLLTYGN